MFRKFNYDAVQYRLMPIVFQVYRYKVQWLYFRLMYINSFQETQVGEIHKQCEKLKANSRYYICWVQGMLSLLSRRAKIAHTYCVSQLLQPPMLTVLLFAQWPLAFVLSQWKVPNIHNIPHQTSAHTHMHSAAHKAATNWGNLQQLQLR